MKKYVFLLIALAFLISGALLLLNRKAEITSLPVPQKHIANVDIFTPVDREIITSYPTLAHIQSKQLSKLATRYSSVVVEIPVHESQRVRKGDLLVRLDSGDVQKTIRALEGKKTTLESEVAVLSKRFHSDALLFKAGAISEERYDNSRLSLANKSALLTELNATLQIQKQQLPYYELRAPYDGIIGTVDIEIGDVTVPGKGLIELHSEPKIARIAYPTTLSIPQNAAVHSHGIFIGNVVSRYADAPQGLYEAEIALEPKSTFVHGEAVPVTVELQKIMHCSVPEKALFKSGKSQTVLENRNGAFVPLAVDVLARDGSYAAVEPCPESSVAVASATKLAALALQNSHEATEHP